MKFLILFSFAVLLGSVCCDSKCFNRKFVTCVESNIDDIKKVYRSCDALNQQARCVYSAALDCETAFIPEAYWNMHSVKLMCAKKDEYLERYRNCFAIAVNGTNCQDKYKNFMKDKKTPKDILGGLKNVCKENDWFGRCLQGNTEDYCGGLASDNFYDSVLIDLLELQELLCSEVFNQTDDEFAVLGLPRIMEVTVALLNIP
ncbi:unnamed protein product [Larinioides sclopetarius]|uniref:DUF19 domain-containing protein n=1 Tax=Larinioides sclopetarius TaxID=280406 RepID=A0AAV2BRD7_9ARAC